MDEMLFGRGGGRNEEMCADKRAWESLSNLVFDELHRPLNLVSEGVDKLNRIEIPLLLLLLMLLTGLGLDLLNRLLMNVAVVDKPLVVMVVVEAALGADLVLLCCASLDRAVGRPAPLVG